MARLRPRRTASIPTSTQALVQIQRDLFALGAQLADPSERLSRRVTKAFIADADVARLESLIDRLESELPPLHALHSGRRLAGRRRAPRRAHGLPPRRAAHGGARAGRRRRCSSATSTGCPICCSCSRASSIIAPACRDALVTAHGVRAVASPALIVAVVSSASRVPPLDVPLDRVEHRARQLLRHALADRAALDQHRPAASSRSRRPSDRARCLPADRRSVVGCSAAASRHGGVDTTAAIGAPLISTRAAAIESLSNRRGRRSETRRRLRENSTRSSAAGHLGDDRPAARALRVARAAGGGAGRTCSVVARLAANSSRTDRDDAGDEVTH